MKQNKLRSYNIVDAHNGHSKNIATKTVQHQIAGTCSSRSQQTFVAPRNDIRTLYHLKLTRRCLFIQQKMKIWSHTAEFKILAFSAVTANMLDFDLFEKVCIFVVWLGRFALFAR